MTDDAPSFRQILRDRHPEISLRTEARLAVRHAVARGDLVKPDACSRCGASVTGRALHAHHHDYHRQLAVEWLCQPCHSSEHIPQARKKSAKQAHEARRRDAIRDVLRRHRLPVSGRLFASLAILVARMEREAVSLSLAKAKP